jgi:hypothetical protein
MYVGGGEEMEEGGEGEDEDSVIYMYSSPPNLRFFEVNRLTVQ